MESQTHLVCTQAPIDANDGETGNQDNVAAENQEYGVEAHNEEIKVEGGNKTNVVHASVPI